VRSGRFESARSGVTASDDLVPAIYCFRFDRHPRTVRGTVTMRAGRFFGVFDDSFAGFDLEFKKLLASLALQCPRPSLHRKSS
jgi:hypothetical protein